MTTIEIIATCATVLIVSVMALLLVLRVTIWAAAKPIYTSVHGIRFYSAEWNQDKDETETPLPTEQQVNLYLAEIERQLALFLIGRGVLSVGTSDLRRVLGKIVVYWREGIRHGSGWRFHDPYANVPGGSGWYAGLRCENRLTVANTPLVEDGALAHEIGHVIGAVFLGDSDPAHSRFPELWEIVG